MEAAVRVWIGAGAGVSAVEAAMRVVMGVGAGAEVLAVTRVGDARVGVEATGMGIEAAERAAEEEIELSVSWAS